MSVRAAIAWVFLGIATVAAPARAMRPDKPGTSEMFRYAPGDKVEAWPTKGGNFSIHFTRVGAHAVPLDDLDKSGVPDHVEQTGALYEEVLASYRKLGFRAPVSDAKVATGNGGDARFDVYLLDFAGKADGAFRPEDCDPEDVCTGFIVQENDFAGYAYPSVTIGNRILASHEFFHAVQAAYDSQEGSILGEGTAVWATEKFDPTLSDFEGFLAGYLTRPDRSLDKPLPGPVDPFSYGSAIFFQFLDERFGAKVIRELIEITENGRHGHEAGNPGWFPDLDALLQLSYGTSFAEAFFEFARWNLYTGKRASAAKSYDRGAGYSYVRLDSEKMPLALPSLRVFPAATSYFKIAPGGRTMVTAALLPGPSTGMRLALTTRRGDAIADPVLAGADLTATVDATGADEVIVVIVNSAQVGESERPAVCVGDGAEVAACRAKLAPMMPMDMAPPSEMPPAGMGGCVVGRSGHSRSVVLALLLFVVLAAHRIRTRRDRPTIQCPDTEVRCITTARRRRW
ncbi:MAG: hypothetical protein EXR72_15095 [Myxococcales bacterium]|nr:hypothetical protein [Myxococcales bacterium]